MHITRVTLTNVKSYSDETDLCFEQGVNLIKGENGAGKSTILEAIGYALFGSLPYTGKEFVRQGQKKGKMIVGFIGYDGREYEVIRSVGTSSMVEVRDVELNVIRATGAEDTVACIRDLLNTGPEADLVSLFEDVIGVPQGTMTAIFAETPRVRETKFSKLLKLESYRTAYEELGKTEKCIRGLLDKNEREQAMLQGELHVLPDYELEFTNLQTDINRDQTEQAANQVRFELLDSALTSHEALKVARDGARQSMGECERVLQRLRDNLETVKTNEHEAEQAQKMLEETRSSYLAYQEAEQRLQQLELQRRERDSLSEKRQNLDGQLKPCATRIELLEQQIDKCHTAASLLITLKPQVEQQSTLESALDQAREDRNERDRLAQQIQQQAPRCDSLRDKIDELDGKLAQRQDLEEIIRQWKQQRDALTVRRDGLREERQPLADGLKSVGAVLVQERERKTQYEQAQKDRTGCADQITSQKALVSRLQQSVEELTQLSRQIVALEIERATAQRDANNAIGDRKSFEKQIDSLQERRDLLDTAGAQCPVCERPLDEHSRGDAERHYQAEFDRLRSALRETEQHEHTEVANVNRIQQQVESLREQIGKRENEQALQRALDELDQLQQKLVEHETEVLRLEDAPSTVQALEAQECAIQIQLQELDHQQTEIQAACERLTGQIDDQQSTLNGLPQSSERGSRQRDYETTRADLEKAQARFAQLAQVDVQIQQLESELATLDDPHTRWLLAQQTASKLAEYEAERAKLLEGQTQLLIEHANVLEQLAAFKGLDTAIDETQQSQNRNREGHALYLRKVDTAKLLDERRIARAQLQREVEMTEQEYEAAQQEFDAAAQAYDAAVHQETADQYRQLCTQQEVLKAKINEKTNQLTLVQKKVERLRGLQAQLTALEREAECLNDELNVFRFVRDSIRDAGEQVRVRLVKSIGQTADSIFGEIIGDYSPTLEWSSDYGITLTQKGETRSFRQLSGGEQMAAALSVRLALLTHMSQVRFIFLDEPTTNLDETRRDALASKLRTLRNVEQLFIISHDDTFGHDGVHQVEIAKVGGLSRILS